MRESLDDFDPWVVFLVTLVLLALASELGFRVAGDSNEGKKNQVGALLAAMLGLLALLLAFILSIVQDRFAERSMLVVEQANTVETVHLRAALLSEPHATQVKRLLRDYVDVHLGVRRPGDLAPAQRETARIHRALWAEAVACAVAQPDSLPAALFVQSVNALIDENQKRLTASVYRRLPGSLLFALYAVALLACFVQGHNGGLSLTRVPLAAIIVGVSISLVITMIMDLDRPWRGGIQVNQEPMQTLQRAYAADR